MAQRDGLADERCFAVGTGGGSGDDGRWGWLRVGLAAATLGGFAGLAACHDVFFAVFAVFNRDAEQHAF